jgi:type IV pilus assembly protein PilQ
MKSLMIMLILVICFGCAGDQKSMKDDPFFEKWHTLAEESKGHSPTAAQRTIDIADRQDAKRQTAALIGEETKQLPQKRINLMMRQADIKAVLRALARSVDINILVKNTLQAEINVDFRDVSWDQAFTGLLQTYGLSYRWEGEILRVMTLDDIEQDLRQKVSIRDTQWVEPLLHPQFVKINFADTKKLSENLVEFLTKDKDGKPRGSIKVDDHNNALIISAIREDLDRILAVIRDVDRPTPQILIRANIVETTKSVARDLGIMWGGRYNTGDHTVLGGGSRTASGAAINPTAAGPVGIGNWPMASNFQASNLTGVASGSLALLFGTIGGNILEIQLQALQKDNKLNILSSPSITTLDNQKAFTENGERVPYITREVDSSGNETRTVKFEDVVLRLEITPHVIDGKNLKMNILVKKDEVDSLRNVDGNPFIIKKQTQTSLIVQDGETIVISGLTKQRLAKGDAGWPLVKNIPVLGYLFKSDSKSDAMEEVLIFITPHILQVAAAENRVPAADTQGSNLVQ